MKVVRKGSKDRIEFTLIDDQTFVPKDIDAGSSECSILDVGGAQISGPHTIAVESLPASLDPVVNVNGKAVYTPASSWDLEIEEGYAVLWTLHDTEVPANVYTRKTFFACVLRGFNSQISDSDINDEDPIAQSRLPVGVKTFAKWRKSAWRDIQLHLSRAINQYSGTIFFQDEIEGAHIAWTLRNFYRSNGSTDGGDEQRTKDWDDKGTDLLNLVLQKIAVDMDESDTLNDATEKQNRQTNWRI